MKKRHEPFGWLRPLVAGALIFAAGLFWGLTSAPRPQPSDYAGRAAAPAAGPVTADHLVKAFVSPRCPHCQKDLAEHGDSWLRWVREGRVRLELAVVPLGKVLREDAVLYCVAAESGFEAYYRALRELSEWYRTRAAGPKPDYAADPAVAECLVQGGGDRALARAVAMADALGVKGTPTYVIDGRPHVGELPLSRLLPLLGVDR